MGFYQINVSSINQYPLVPNVAVINTTSSSKEQWSRGLSPFFLGPIPLYSTFSAQNMENAWQYSKVYPKHLDADGEPSAEYWKWAQAGWHKKWADRYPMGKGQIPAYSYWDGQKLGYVEARKKIYAPLYAAAVEKTDAFRHLKVIYDSGQQIWLQDFDGYDFCSLGMSYEDVLNDETRKMGHAFVLAMMLEGKRVWACGS